MSITGGLVSSSAAAVSSHTCCVSAKVVPSFGQHLNGNVALTQQVWDDTAAALELTKPPVIDMK